MKHLPLLPALFLLLLFVSSSTAEAGIVSFRNIIAAGPGGVGIPYQGNTVIASGAIIYGNGYIDAGLAPPTGHGTGFANNYTGTLFREMADLALPGNTTRLEGQGLYAGNGDADNMDNFVGFHVSFSDPIPMYDFFMTDIDGLEYGFSFALNGSSFIDSRIELGNPGTLESITHDFDSAAMQTAIGNSPTSIDPAANIPSSMQVARTLNGNNVTGDSPDGQVRFAYDGQEVTDLVFGWGFWSNRTDTGSQRSGVTGISVVVSSVPEPSSATLFAITAAGLLFRRRR